MTWSSCRTSTHSFKMISAYGFVVILPFAFFHFVDLVVYLFYFIYFFCCCFFMWHDDVGSLCVQLFLRFYTKLLDYFRCFYQSLKVCMSFWYNPHVNFCLFFFFFFFFFFHLLFSGLITEYTTCLCNFYSFPSIIMKFCRFILHALKKCICICGYPLFIFSNFFFHFFDLFLGFIVLRHYLKGLLKC